MKALITGITGFVGKHLANELHRNNYEVYGADIIAKDENTLECDILDRVSIQNVLEQVKPNVIFHMAGQSSVAKSWSNPNLTFDLNVKGTINLLETIKMFDNEIQVLLIGSSDQYGKITVQDGIVNEEVPLCPATPYAVSKCAQEELGKLYHSAYGMNIYLTRSFNHIGIGQSKGFVIPDVASGIAEIEKHKSDTLKIGNLAVKRDFCDVKDIVRAYRLIVEKGRSGVVYNVGSGESYCIQELVDKLIAMSKCTIKIERDPSRMRPSDVPCIQCDHSRLTQEIGWQPEIEIEKTLKDILDYFRTVIEDEE
ncbi:GDP-mannose 4,6-dehydratase [Cellulosilyticum lentocellum]|uniref:GDP-mannose 4,6-dehydratase n=1 Tax=Cellulosilyticum lentocellum (strain ATCC 49066 / DSM 5427 / NCIMB 11756 / RHM5) TaxID=642492 RepID=F2JIM5_CELLD|nr:GDP-mannose 4,6-dehydratase [Cellulosilyticum lentocellum]ADZ85495.1 GDP-mannose 4,6-dehydratase [Cellulosilyticum lentocellum DSM 5427]